MNGSLQLMVIGLSVVAAGGGVAAVILPMLNRAQKKERYNAIIQKKRRDLFEQTKKEAANRGKKQVSARETMAMLYKLESLLGGMGERARNKMLQAGIRDPAAPMKFMLARVFVPAFLIVIGMAIISGSEKEVSSAWRAIIIVGGGAFGFMLPGILIKNQAQKRLQEINYAFPDALDMMLICVTGGIGLEQTVNRIADEIAEHSPILAEELGILSAEMAMLSDRRSALQDFARRVGSGAARSFATALIQAEQYGTSVSQAMRTMSEELRDSRMQEAERKAASLPPKLTVPMILFFLPVIFVVILGPAVLQAMDTLGKK
jgi:tight adherence protein C